MSRLIDGPMMPWIGEVAEEVPTLDEPDLGGFELLQDSRVLDFRKWTPTAPGKDDPGSLGPVDSVVLFAVWG
jgi:hypothetical protein